MAAVNESVLLWLKTYRKSLTGQQYRTLRGQVLAGDANGAMRGLKKIIWRRRRERLAGGATAEQD